MCMRCGCHSTWVRFEMLREPSPCEIGFSMWHDKWNHVHPIWSCIINVHMFLRWRMWSSLIREDMNKLVYNFFLRGYSVWNLHVAHVDSMGWSILPRLGNLDVPLLVLSRWECTNGIMWVRYYMSSRASFVNIFWYYMHMRKDKLTFHCICAYLWIV